ncbi:hypothetical protein [Salinibaculum rarum]|uniref:hypothetical protein n=1 Tax=Salinibaculum rarum TaxID=3058903 RepID=UPI00265E925F|nr:hypothetical protein [Salinibaculum sp. KK48]
MIPTRLLTYTIRATSIETACATAIEYAADILETTDATFARICNPPTCDGFNDTSTIGTIPSTYRRISNPGIIPLTEPPRNSETTNSDVERYFDALTATNDQLVALQEAFRAQTTRKIPTAIGAACVTVALSRTYMRYRHAKHQSITPPLNELADPEHWYTGTGQKDFHPDLTAEMAALLSTHTTRETLADSLTDHLPNHHLFIDDTPVVTLGDYITSITESPQRDSKWFLVPVDVGIGTGGE